MREIALHILDVARNSIEAGATDLQLTVTEDGGADRLEFEVRDNGRGLPPEALERVTDAFYTTRTTRRVGMGLALLEATCRRCEGDLVVRSEPGRGTTVRGVLRLGHVDRPPLGDMGGVIQALVCEAARTRLRYRHVVDGRAFELDTSGLQAELGEVPLSHPSVLQWVGEHVNGGLREVGGRA